MQTCVINKLSIGGDAPVRLMGVINCSPESFYQNSFFPIDLVHETAVTMVEQGADIIDIGARSTAPNTQAISGKTEAQRIDAALSELDGSGITVSVDTMHPGVLDVCLKHEIHAVNDITGLSSPVYAQKVADSGLPAIVMASYEQPGDAVGMDATLDALAGVVARCERFGIRDYVLDPGVGLWTPSRSVDDNWQLCQQFDDFLKFDRPLLAAISRKTFIGELIRRDPADRLAASLAVTMLLLQKGAAIVRTHDVRETHDAIRVYERMVKGR
ncbi:MAG: dihydropteroate synthase [Methanoregula sp.]|nr:dihydropteroate synthase [Methanoregula sp.]